MELEMSAKTAPSH